MGLRSANSSVLDCVKSDTIQLFHTMYPISTAHQPGFSPLNASQIRSTCSNQTKLDDLHFGCRSLLHQEACLLLDKICRRERRLTFQCFCYVVGGWGGFRLRLIYTTAAGRLLRSAVDGSAWLPAAPLSRHPTQGPGLPVPR